MKKSFILLVSTLLLTACDGLLTSSSSSSNEENMNNYYLADNVKYTLKDINQVSGWHTSTSTGDQKFLIVPIVLNDCQTSYPWTEKKLNNIKKVFFDRENDSSLGFESVSSYFYKSSYGKLNITGEVTTPFVSNYTTTNLNRMSTNGAGAVINEWYKSNNANSELLSKYDLDKDGRVDNCIFVYSNVYESGTNSAFWAWCSDVGLSKKDYNTPSIGNYMWVSYDFVDDKYVDFYNYNKLDTHTFIHESGHLLGLNDYYCYDTNNSWDPAGVLDMQSYNVGDHNIYSKMSLGWVNPYVVTGDSVIKLKTSSKYPEAILINDNWNGSIFDEYLLIEYYTPTNLNEQDAKHNFNGRGKMYSYKGLRIYHVDARLVETSINTVTRTFNKSSNYTDTIYNDSFNNKFSVIGASNSVTRSYLQDYSNTFRQLHLLDQGEKNYLPSNNRVGNINPSSALWTSRTFTPNNKFFQFSDRFNNKSKIGYEISVRNLTNEDCEVVIKKINN